LKIISLLDELGWTQFRLAIEAHVSPSTIRRLVQGAVVNRQTAEAICTTLSRALERKIGLRDIDELSMSPAERPERRKSASEGDQGEEET
jgi:transcriptional regulator with XRE-family HTH domain